MICALVRRLAVLLVLSSLVAASPAAADTLAILRPRFEPGASTELGARALRALADHLQAEAFALREVRHTDAALPPELRDCADVDCAARAARLLDADVTLYFTLSRAAGRHRVAIALLDRKGRSFEQVAHIGEEHGPEQAALAAFEQALSELQAGARPELTVEGSPAGAEVLIDGRVVGRLPYSGRVEEGPVEVTVRRPGYVTVTRRLTASAADEPLALSVELEPAAEAPIAEPSDGAPELEGEPPVRRASAWNYVLAAGFAAAGVGLAVSPIATAEAAASNECIGTRDFAQRCSQRAKFGERSLILSGLAALSLATSAFFVVATPLSAEVDLDRGAVSMQWTGSF